MTSLNFIYNEYSTNLNNRLNQLLETAQNADVTFAVEGQLVKAHQIILSMFSTYFQELFAANPCPHSIFFMKDVSYNVIRDILRFIYAGEVQIAQEDVRSFLDTATALKVNGLSHLTETQQSTRLPEPQILEQVENDQIGNNITLSSNQLDHSHDTHPDEVTNKRQRKEEPKSSSLGYDVANDVNYVKHELHDRSMDIEESQIQLPVHAIHRRPEECITHEKLHEEDDVEEEDNEEEEEDNDDDVKYIGEIEDNEEDDVGDEVLAEKGDNEDENVTVKFVENYRGKAIIINDFRYFENHATRSQNRNAKIRRFSCSKIRSTKCRANVILTRDGYILLRNKHSSACSLTRRHSLGRDTILKEQAYFKYPIRK